MAQGGCHCGAVRFEVTGAPARVALCHCGDCRRHAGAPMVAWAIVGANQFRVLQGALATYASSEHGRRHFCAACGTGLTYTNAEFAPGTVDVQVAAMDDPDLFRPTAHVQVAERIGWMATAHELPMHARFAGGL
jgi:hypothetical protein